MHAFQEFRTWATSTSVAERATTTVAGLVVAGLLVWLLVPSPQGTTNAASVSTAATDGGGRSSANPGASALASAPASGGVPSSPGATGGASGATSLVGVQAGPGGSGGAPAVAPSTGQAAAAGVRAGGGTGCVSPPGSARGVSASEIKLAVAVVDVAGPAANGLFGLPSADEQISAYQAVIDDTNKAGGIACRKVVADYYRVNPADQSSMHQQCLDIAQSGVYAVLDAGSYASVTTEPLTCFAQHKVTYFGAYLTPAWQAQQLYPYIFSFGTFENVYRDTAFALRDLGFFEPARGFKKLGYLYHSCDPRKIGVYTTSLHRAGVTDAQIVPYDLGCPAAFASPADLAQAVLKFKQSGVTHVTEAGALGDIANYTKISEQQGFRPKYGLPDEALVQISYGAQRADPNNIAGAIAITDSRNGENTTPGLPLAPGTVRCNAIYAARRLRSTYQEPAGAGNSCSLMWMFRAALEHAPAMDPTTIGLGLQRARSVEFSFPQGPNDFTAARATSGGQFWRALMYRSDCQCWQVTNPSFRPSFR